MVVIHGGTILFYLARYFVAAYPSPEILPPPPAIIGLLITTVFLWRWHLVYAGAGPERTYNGFDVHSDTLLIGCALAFIDLSPAIKTLAKNFAFIPMAFLIFIFVTFQFKSELTHSVGITLNGLCSAWIIIAAIEGGFVKRLLSFRFLVYTGRISYGWYLWHFPILEIGRQHFRMPHETSFLVAASYLTAMASYHFVERPFLRLKDHFEPKDVQSHEPLDIGPVSGAVGSKQA
jgi:peptidoglycan/LPS O-acetylase OafA/YrhL